MSDATTPSQGQPLVWFITGASAGFGNILTRTILARGDRVIASARSLDKLKAKLQDSAPAPFDGVDTNTDNLRVDTHTDNLRTLQLDVTDSEDAIKAKAKEAVDVWGRVDVLVNNAGVGAPGIAEEVGAAGFLQQFRTNFFGAINVTNAFLPYMRAAKSGTIVFMGSRHAWMTRNPGIDTWFVNLYIHLIVQEIDMGTLGPYNSSKAALHAYAETLHNEIKQFNITILIAQPGAHRTDVITTSLSNILPPIHGSIADYTPLREAISARYGKQNGKQPGDPVKAMRAVVDVVRGEGVAEERVRKREGERPLWLVLGTDAEADLREFCRNRMENLEEWVDVTRGCAADDGEAVLV
ncbi:hypothetical protein BC629DRAFT_1442182 [Irpex lacteus]|nr:hypothetical protein BC629DRAFT_1442182 [Irpex lacteus]